MEIFQEEVDDTFVGIPGTFPCADDVKTQGFTEVRHDINCLETVSAEQRKGLKFNPDKCCIKKETISFFSRIISKEGIKPCPTKVQAILDMEPPGNKQELQSFLGSVNFLSSFVPNLSQQTFIMRGLLKKDVHYVWTPEMQDEFNKTQRAISNSVQLIHFDSKLPVVMETDASLKGLGAVIIQDGRPVKFLS